MASWQIQGMTLQGYLWILQLFFYWWVGISVFSGQPSYRTFPKLLDPLNTIRIWIPHWKLNEHYANCGLLVFLVSLEGRQALLPSFFGPGKACTYQPTFGPATNTNSFRLEGKCLETWEMDYPSVKGKLGPKDVDFEKSPRQDQTRFSTASLSKELGTSRLALKAQGSKYPSISLCDSPASSRPESGFARLREGTHSLFSPVKPAGVKVSIHLQWGRRGGEKWSSCHRTLTFFFVSMEFVKNGTWPSS